ncbi:hypothetical protein JTF08_13600 [Micrococcaceae bacterium RIT802]|nr:hypothetical protein [Micrococcaceae bacterium RIT 802]
MRPGFINAVKLDTAEQLRVSRWMHANGLRHYVPGDARIIIMGNRFRVETCDIERIVPPPAQRRRGDPKRWYQTKTDRWFHVGKTRLPAKVRTYRIRYPLKDFK